MVGAGSAFESGKGRSEEGAGGAVGPMARRGFGLDELGDKLRERLRGEEETSSLDRLRFAIRCEGKVGPIVVMVKSSEQEYNTTSFSKLVSGFIREA